MADFGSPVAQNVNPPNGLQTLSSLLSLKQQQQAIQGQAADVQQAQQNARQRAGIATFMSNFDPDQHVGADGTLDLDGVFADPKLRQAAGDQFPALMQQMLQIKGQQLQNKQALVNLNDDTRKQFMAIGGSLRTDPDVIADTPAGRQKVNEAFGQFAATSPDAARIANIYGGVTQHAPQGQLAQALSNMQLQAEDAATQAGKQTPEYANIGSKVVNVNPQAAGVGSGGGPTLTGSPPINTTVPPADRTDVRINPITGQPYTVNKPESGLGASVGSASTPTPSQDQRGWATLPSFPSPQQAQSATQAGAEADAVRAGDSNPVTGYAPTKQVYSNLFDLVDKNPSIGPKSKAWNDLTAVLTPFGANLNSSMQEVDSYLDRLALQNAGAAGLSTDSARQMSAVAAGTSEMNPAALREKLRFGAALLEANHAYRQGLDNVIGTNNQNPIAKRQFDSLWSSNADVNAFRLLSAKQRGDTEDFNATLKKIQSLPPEQRLVVQKHMRNLNALVNGQLPQ